MANLDWGSALGEVRRKCRDFAAMWPSVAFRVAGVSKADQPNLLDAAAANFQALPFELPDASTRVTADPDVLQGIMTIRDFVELLKFWRNNEVAPCAQFWLAPPRDISQLDWALDLPEDMIWGPLLEKLPSSDSLYRVHRLVGGGGQVSSEMRRLLLEETLRLRLAPSGWSQEYLGMVWDGNMNYLMIHLPVAVRLEANYDRQIGELRLDIYFRAPYRLDQFWSRISPGRWNISLPRHSFNPLPADGQGWAGGTLQVVEKFDGAVHAWVGTTGVPNKFDWEVVVGGREPQAAASAQAKSTDAPAQLITDLRGLISPVASSEVASFLDEALRCLEVGAFRAAAIMVWAGAIAVLQDAAGQHGLKLVEQAAKSVNRKAHDLHHKNDLQYFTDDLLLNALEKTGILNRTELGLLLQQLKRRNAYAHPSGVEPSVEEVRAMIAELVKIVFSRFATDQPP